MDAPVIEHTLRRACAAGTFPFASAEIFERFVALLVEYQYYHPKFVEKALTR